MPTPTRQPLLGGGGRRTRTCQFGFLRPSFFYTTAVVGRVIIDHPFLDPTQQQSLGTTSCTQLQTPENIITSSSSSSFPSLVVLRSLLPYSRWSLKYGYEFFFCKFVAASAAFEKPPSSSIIHAVCAERDPYSTRRLHLLVPWACVLSRLPFVPSLPPSIGHASEQAG